MKNSKFRAWDEQNKEWLCKSAWDNYFIIEGEKAFFKTGGYDRQQVKLLSTRKVEID